MPSKTKEYKKSDSQEEETQDTFLQSTTLRNQCRRYFNMNMRDCLYYWMEGVFINDKGKIDWYRGGGCTNPKGLVPDRIVDDLVIDIESGEITHITPEVKKLLKRRLKVCVR